MCLRTERALTWVAAAQRHILLVFVSHLYRCPSLEQLYILSLISCVCLRAFSAVFRLTIFRSQLIIALRIGDRFALLMTLCTRWDCSASCCGARHTADHRESFLKNNFFLRFAQTGSAKIWIYFWNSDFCTHIFESERHSNDKSSYKIRI